MTNRWLSGIRYWGSSPHRSNDTNKNNANIKVIVKLQFRQGKEYFPRNLIHGIMLVMGETTFDGYITYISFSCLASLNCQMQWRDRRKNGCRRQGGWIKEAALPPRLLRLLQPQKPSPMRLGIESWSRVGIEVSNKEI